MLKSYYDKVKTHQVEIISAAVEDRVMNCWEGVHEALVEALRNGTYRTAAVVMRAVNLWDWANAESEEEEYKCRMGLKDCHQEAENGDQVDKSGKPEKSDHADVVEAVDKAADKVVEAVATSAVKA